MFIYFLQLNFPHDCLFDGTLQTLDFQYNLKRDHLEIQHPKFENSRLGFIESVHEG